MDLNGLLGALFILDFSSRLFLFTFDLCVAVEVKRGWFVVCLLWLVVSAVDFFLIVLLFGVICYCFLCYCYHYCLYYRMVIMKLFSHSNSFYCYC